MKHGGPAATRGGRTVRERLLLALPIAGLCLGIALLAAPVVMDVREAWLGRQAISQADATNTDPRHDYYLAQARAYNAQLAGETPDIPTDELLPYEQQLDSVEKQVVAWIEIPRIAVQLPVYLGTSDAVLAQGVGHVEWSSLPVGGASTHAVLTGHSGMFDSRMFDDIRLLEVGDLFAVHSLGDEYVYEVTSIRTVWPQEVDSLQIAAGEDLCTLVTCTPYGVNDHRLLVTGARTTRQLESATAAQAALAYATRPRVWPLLAGMAAAVAVICVVLARRRRRRKGVRP